MSQKKQIGIGYIRASFDSNTIDKENRTIDVVFATETPVLRMGWDGMFMEVLQCSPEAVMVERLNSGAGPVLDTHDRYSVRNQLGAVEPNSVIIKSKECRCKLRFSKREDVNGVWQDIEDGILRNISVGYNTYETTLEEKQGALPTYTSTRWEPMEVSLVPVPADYNSKVREAETTHEVTIINNSKNKTMANERQEGAEETTATPAATPAQNIIPATVPTSETSEEVRSQVTKLERTRAAEILKACRTAKLPETYATELVASEKNLDQCRAAIINKMTENQPEVSGLQSTIKIGADETDKRSEGMVNAIIHRVDPREVTADKAGEYRGMSLLDMAREWLTAEGKNVRGMTKREVAKLSLGLVRSGGYSTSDFPNILSAAFNKRLRKAYDLQSRTFLTWANASTATDFKEMSRLQLGDLKFEEVKEGGEYKSENLSESVEKYKVAKWGRIVNINWEAIVNDDLNAFSRIPQILAGAAAQKQSDIVYGILTANANMADGTALFHADHGNLTGSGTAISVTSLGVGRALMRKQKSIGSKNHLNLAPKFLIVGPDQESLALQYTSQNYVSAKSSDINVWAGMMQPIIESRLTGNPWYLAADSTLIDTIEFAFLDGEELYTEERIAFEKDAYEFKARMVFGAKAIDYRGLYKNVGA